MRRDWTQLDIISDHISKFHRMIFNGAARDLHVVERHGVIGEFLVCLVPLPAISTMSCGCARAMARAIASVRSAIFS